MQWHSKVFGGLCAEFRWWAPWLPGSFSLLIGPLRLRGAFRLLRASQIDEAPRISGAPQIAGGASDCWGPLRLMGPLRLSGAFRLLRTPQIVEAPRIFRAPQIAGAPQIDGAPQIVGALQIAEGPRGPFRLVRAPQIDGAPQIVGGPQMAGGSCALHKMHNPFLYATLAMGPNKDHGWGSWILVKWPSYNRHWTEHLNSQNCKWPIFSFWISWLAKKVLSSIFIV